MSRWQGESFFVWWYGKSRLNQIHASILWVSKNTNNTIITKLTQSAEILDNKNRGQVYEDIKAHIVGNSKSKLWWSNPVQLCSHRDAFKIF